MAFSNPSAVVCATVTILLALVFIPAKADVRAVNNCPFDLTVFWQSQAPNDRQQLYFPSQSAVQLNLPNPWIGGVIWASQTSNPDNGQATQLEITINGNFQGWDSYDISVVNAYNLPAKITPTYIANGDVSSGLECGTPSCIIPDLSAVCALNNFYAGPDPCCVNADGPGLQYTPGIQLFQDQCPAAYVLSNDSQFVVYTCATGTEYDAVWCP